MATSNKTTYYDRQKKWMKNNRLIVIIFFFLMGITILGGATDSFSKIKNFVHNKSETKKADNASGQEVRSVENMRPSVENAVVNDPDGYLNVRSGPGKEYQIIGIVNNGEYIDIYTSDGDWLLIKANDKLTGYVYKNRIKL
jgi:hypothetical protein